jgi:murein DD-endopeptidase MepM/ murein hydrolase activator NlpD
MPHLPDLLRQVLAGGVLLLLSISIMASCGQLVVPPEREPDEILAERPFFSLQPRPTTTLFTAELAPRRSVLDMVLHNGQLFDAPDILPPGFLRHTLQRGEHLTGVAQRYRISLLALVGANPQLSSLDLLPVGLELLIPPSEGLVVRLDHPFELPALLVLYDIDAGLVAKANAIVRPLDLRPRMLLFLPGVYPGEAMERLYRVRQQNNTYQWPLQGHLTDRFGWRGRGFHHGLDIAAPTGTPFTASRDGHVDHAAWHGGYGLTVRLRHPGGDETLYAHASRLLVNVGDYVVQGQHIGVVGSTGYSTGPHLHFEIRRDGSAINPLTLLP